MPTTYRVLGQSTPSANTETALYTVPGSNAAVISTIAVCNQAAANAAVAISIAVGNAAANTSQYIMKDAFVQQYDTLFLTVGATMAATDQMRVTANVANISFSAFGSEIS